MSNVRLFIFNIDVELLFNGYEYRNVQCSGLHSALVYSAVTFHAIHIMICVVAVARLAFCSITILKNKRKLIHENNGDKMKFTSLDGTTNVY